MNSIPAVVEKNIHLSAEHADRLSHLARSRQLAEGQIVEKALDILFALTDLLDEQTERVGWSVLSEESLRRIWDNDQDAAYDDWEKLYDAPAR
jgi:hypothetical protein